MKTLVDKYKPKVSTDIPQEAIGELKNLILYNEKVLLFGPAGSCKTSAVYAIANELDLEVLELNASDMRNRDSIEKIVGEGSRQSSLFFKSKIILIDEAENFSGMADRGGSKAIVDILKDISLPVVLTANDSSSDKIKDIKKLCVCIAFPGVSIKNICDILKDICIKENVEFSESDIRHIAANSSGDLRATINDLQCCIMGNKIDVSDLTPREYESTVNNVLSCVFKLRSFDVFRTLDSINLSHNEFMMWVDENIPYEYKNVDDIFNSYERLSKADIFKSRITRWQYWRFLYYSIICSSSGISLSKTKSYPGIVKYKRSIRPLRIWQANMKYQKRKAISVKLAAATHCSVKDVIKNFKYYQGFISNDLVYKEIGLTNEGL